MVLGFLAAIVRKPDMDVVLRVLENGSDGGEGDVLVGRPKQDIELVELLRTRGLRGPLAVVLV